eukprot:10566915-Lingulodinium_polyedra.AAC.1
MQDWAHSGLAKRTEHHSKDGKLVDICWYMQKEWLSQNSEWNAAAGLPTTNNGCEAAVKYTRNNAGNSVKSVPTLVAFMLREVSARSLDMVPPEQRSACACRARLPPR